MYASRRTLAASQRGIESERPLLFLDSDLQAIFIILRICFTFYVGFYRLFVFSRHNIQQRG